MCSGGVANGPGMGKLMAELVTEGSCSWDVSGIDIKRLTREQNNKLFLRDRVKQILGKHYTIPYPELQITSGRPLKTSPLYDLLTTNGAEWGEIGGWERPRWFNKDSIGKFSFNLFNIVVVCCLFSFKYKFLSTMLQFEPKDKNDSEKHIFCYSKLKIPILFQLFFSFYELFAYISIAFVSICFVIQFASFPILILVMKHSMLQVHDLVNLDLFVVLC